MPSTPYAQFEEHVGPHGLKIARILTGTKQEPTVSVVHPLDSQKLYSQETELSQAVARLSRSWRWWAESYGYFNRKSDAQVFEEEVHYLLTHRLFSPSLTQWQLTGVRNTYNDRGPRQEMFFIDPDTEQVISTHDSYNQPNILEDSSEILGYLNVDLLADPKILQQAVKLATIVLDVSLYMTGSSNAGVIEKLITTRPIRFALVSTQEIASEVQDGIKQHAITTSAEISSITDGKVAGETNGDEYVNYLIETYRLRNTITIELSTSETSYQILGLEKPKPVEVISADSEPKTDGKKAKRSKAAAVIHSDVQLAANAHFHRFEIDGAECYLIAELDEQGKVQRVEVQHPQYSPRENELLRTAVHLLLETGGNGTKFDQPVIDYLNQWIQS